MKGRSEFTRREADTIGALLRQKDLADEDEQKGIRSRLRRMGFYITDFDDSYQGFDASDFDSLVRFGYIKIIE